MNFNIFKRKQNIKNILPEPNFKDNWLSDHYLNNVKTGINELQKGNTVTIHDDGRGFELACDIKKQFINEYAKQLSEKIEIEGMSGLGNLIKIKIKNDK